MKILLILGGLASFGTVLGLGVISLLEKVSYNGRPVRDILLREDDGSQDDPSDDNH